MKNIHYIYKITCLLGSLKGHYYIGKHSTSRPQDKYYGSGTVLRDYYKKYGKKDGVTFIKEILEYNDTFEKNMDREREIIGDLWKTDPMCMNLCNGGYGPSEFKISEETRQKLIASHKGKPSPKKGKPSPNNCRPCTEETKIKISKANKGRKRTDTPCNKGKTIEQIRGKNNYQAKPVYQYTLDGEFVKVWDCLIDVQRDCGYKNSVICRCCKGYKKTAYGYIWKYVA